MWHEYELPIGGTVYPAVGLLDLLRYGGPDAATKLARQLVAAKLNVLSGSDSSIEPVMDTADAFLVEFPPGSDPDGADQDYALMLRDLLEDYNHSCTPCQPKAPSWCARQGNCGIA